MRDGTLTIEHASEPLAQYQVTLESNGYGLRAAAEPWFFATRHASPRLFLAPLEDAEWHPAQRPAPYRPRRKRVAAEQQAPLPEPERAASAG